MPSGGGRGGDPVAVCPGVVDECLEIRFHRAELVRADVERRVRSLGVDRQEQIDGGHDIVDVDELIGVLARADKRNIGSAFDPVEQDLEDAQPLWADDCLWPQDGDTVALVTVLLDYRLGFDLRFAVDASRA